MKPSTHIFVIPPLLPNRNKIAVHRSSLHQFRGRVGNATDPSRSRSGFEMSNYRKVCSSGNIVSEGSDATMRRKVKEKMIDPIQYPYLLSHLSSSLPLAKVVSQRFHELV